jgi:hypothetical protein
METTDYLPADVARVFDWAWAPILADFRHARTPDSLAIVTNNVYRRLPSGNYGRGDVRAAILAVWGHDADTWDVECERRAAVDAEGEA